MEIRAEHVGVTIGHHHILDGVSMRCAGGTMTALVGPSGSGKTTLLHCLGLLLKPTTGRVLIEGADTTGWGDGRRRRFWHASGAFVLQDYGVMEEESVAFNVTMRASVWRSTPRGDLRRLEAALDEVGLGGRSNDPAAHLSGGEKQRLSIARAIYKDASAIFVDEPTASLDQENRTRMIDLFRALSGRGRTVVVATHDEEMIRACDARFSLEPGTASSAGGHLAAAMTGRG